MAKLTANEYALIQAGHNGQPCPGMWSSRNWDFWAFGEWLATTGMTLGPRNYWEKRRGRIFQNPAGFSYQITPTTAPAYNVLRVD
ncbi:MAG: hypothetical protein KGO96_12325 [Elusimicrobia bacterium]|nr:hypothetical protein [Elusimicrobiota bacterium]